MNWGTNENEEWSQVNSQMSMFQEMIKINSDISKKIHYDCPTQSAMKLQLHSSL